MIVFAQEKLIDCLDEIKALAPAQWEEMSEGFDGIPLDPQWDLYLRLVEAAPSVLVTAREDGHLVGYVGAYIQPFSSSKSMLVAVSTPYFVSPVKWRGMILRDLFRELLAELKKRGVRLATVKTHPWASAGPVLQNLKMRPIETLYMIDLERTQNA